MNYNIKKLSKSQIEISASLTKEEYDVFLRSALDYFAAEVELDGFRRGKAPLAMVREHIGEQKLKARAAENVIQKNFQEIIAKEKLAIIGQPDAEIKTFEPDFSFIIKTAVFPEIKLPDYRDIAKKNLKTKKLETVEEKEVTDALNWLRDSRAATVTVTRGAQKNDRVEVDFTIKDNGVIIEGGKSENHPLLIGSGKFIPGFEDQLLDMKAGENKNFQLTMPKDYANGLGGKKLDFLVIMKLVQERILPELTDDFAKGLGKFSNLTELTSNIRDGLQKEKEEKEKQRIDMLIADAIIAETKIEIPDIMIENELEKMTNEFEANLQKMGMELAKYLEHIKKTEADLKKEWQKDAKRRVAIALVLRAIADAEHIEPTAEDIETYANKSLDLFRAEGHNIENIDKTALQEYSKNILRNKKVFEFLEQQI